MFGYVTVCREVMSKDDYAVFQSYYCGVCKATGRCTSNLARIGLSYDITFLALVLSSVINEKDITVTGGCIAHPFKKREFISQNNAVDYSACMGVMLSYLKLIDDIHDDKSIKAASMAVLFHHGVKKAQLKYNSQYNIITDYLKKLQMLEKENSADIDRCADCFAKILETLFTPDFIADSNTKRILAWMGYNTGRWIYIIDAYNDMEKDMKRKKYNPFLAEKCSNFDEHRRKIKEQLKTSLTFTLENIASSFELLKIYKNKSIIEHIIYQGLRARQSVILGEENGSL